MKKMETRDYMKRMTSGFFADSLHAGVARSKAALEEAVKTGKQADGTALTDEIRRQKETEIEETVAFAKEVAALPRVLPNLVFRDELTFWSGARELRREWGQAPPGVGSHLSSFQKNEGVTLV